MEYSSIIHLVVESLELCFSTSQAPLTRPAARLELVFDSGSAGVGDRTFLWCLVDQSSNPNQAWPFSHRKTHFSWQLCRLKSIVFVIYFYLYIYTNILKIFGLFVITVLVFIGQLWIFFNAFHKKLSKHRVSGFNRNISVYIFLIFMLCM